MKNKKLGINVLSLFDGMSCGQIALERAGIKVNKYFASEIDKYAIKVTMANYSNTIQLGCIKDIDLKALPKIDLLMGGSPCQGFSFTGKQLNFDDSRSKLFFEFVKILRVLKPNYFLLENVFMKKKSKDIISKELKVKPIEICSSLVSAQTRKRLYWTNIKGVYKLPKNKRIFIKDIMENILLQDRIFMKKNRILFHKKRPTFMQFGNFNVSNRAYYMRGKHGALMVSNYGGYIFLNNNKIIRLTQIECERLQTVPDNYTNYVSDSQRCKMLGNGWTVDAIVHIFKGLK